MTDVFISYSRKDADFVRRLHTALAASKRDTWVDWEDIPASADWWKEVTAGIEAADAFVFIISPDSVHSDVCRREIDHAVENNKRMVPILYRPVDNPDDQKLMHPSVGSHNWIFFRDTDSFDTAFQALLNALDTDLSHVRQHTRLLVRAKEWEASGKNDSFLLRGSDLSQAEDWLAQGVAKKPAPTALHAEYINASRDAAVRRQRTLLAGVTFALVVALGLAVLSLLLFGESNRQRGFADNNAATAVVAQGNAQTEAANAQTQAFRAENNAATATIAQGRAQIEADNAQTQAARAQNEANNAATQAAIAQNNAATATYAQGDAQMKATAVAQERNRAQSIAYAAQAQLELASDPTRSALIGLYALQNYPYTWQAERALGNAVQSHLARERISGAGAFVSVDWSPDGTKLVASEDNGTILITDVSGTVLQTLSRHTKSVPRALWSPDGNFIASASLDQSAIIWDAQTGQVVRTLSGHTAGVYALAWSPDGTRLATAGSDKTAIIWDAQTGTIIAKLLGHSAPVNSVAWSPDGTKLVTGSDDATARVWDADGKLIFALTGHEGAVNRAVWSPDGKNILTLSSDTTGKVWDAATGKESFTLNGHVRAVLRGGWSSTGGRIATVSEDDTARIWGGRSGAGQFTLYGHTDSLSGVAWSPDGGRVVTISEDRTAQIWDASTGNQMLVLTGHTAPLFSVAWSPDGTHIATASGDKTVRIWEVWKDSPSLIAFAQNCCTSRHLTDEESSKFGIPPAPSAPPPAEITSCPDTLPSRLYLGTRGQVTQDDKDNLALNVRSQPGRNATQLGQISPRKNFWVVGEVECADGLAWFPVIYGVNAASGWIAEGEGDAYFVKPLS
ncbi:MAG: TIR domain-containing protein [Chloroflexota bacterium]